MSRSFEGVYKLAAINTTVNKLARRRRVRARARVLFNENLQGNSHHKLRNRSSNRDAATRAREL